MPCGRSWRRHGRVSTALLAINPDMPVLFVTTRQTHADDLAATLEDREMLHLLQDAGFVNYRDYHQSHAAPPNWQRVRIGMVRTHTHNLVLYLAHETHTRVGRSTARTIRA